MASTSVSSIQKSFKYDVYLSFRGEDTRKNFVDHLYHALTQKGIETYKDDENMKQGKMISDELIEAIEDSKFYIIIFSKSYASSSWCLEELVKIMECRKGFGHTAYPVFYDVEPTEVRKQTGSVGDAFAKHKEEEAAGKWREALKEASYLAGFELKSIANGHEAKFIQKIVEEISLELRFINSSSDGNLIGMETRVDKVISSLEPGVGDVRMLGIWGMGGAGKTTLARAIFDQISIQFEGESFIENVKEISKASSEGLNKLQKQVLSDVLKDQNITVSSVSGGKSMMQKMMRGRKVLVVLDDVDHKDQLEALAGDRNWFKPGSRIIITTRDEQVLVAHRVSLIHNVTLLSQAEASCLFSRYAFGREIPTRGYEELSGQVVQYAAGLPLTIKVLGSFLCGQSEPYWVDATERLKKIPLKATMERLEISFDGLEDDYKEIFLDVACILKGWHKEDAIRALESRGFHAEVGLRVLEQRSLITISGYWSTLGMHDHLEEMGRNIVRRTHPDEPQRHSRLWINEEIEYILTNDLGSQATKCLHLYSEDLSAEIAVKGLSKMKDLRFVLMNLYKDYFKGNIVQFDKVSEYLPSSLRFMRWWGFPFSSLPNTFQGNYLVELEIERSNIVQLWEDGEEKVLNNLRFLKIRTSKLRTFDLRLALNLEQLTISHCYDFVELHMPAHHLKLKYLTLTNSKLTNLYLGNTPNLVELNLQQLYEITNLHLGNTPNLVQLNLEQFYKITNLHLGNTSNLKTLELNGCHNLVEFQMPAESLKLEYLHIISHSKLRNIHLGNTPNLKTLILESCYDLVELKMPAESPKLEWVNLSQSNLKNLHLGNTPNLKKLELRDCCDLVEFQMPAESLKLEELYLTHSQLKTIHLGNSTNLERLILGWCNDLVEFQMPFKNLKLKYLDLSHSHLKTIHLENTPNLEMLILDWCNDLVELQIPVENLKLKYLDLSHSRLKIIHLGNNLNLTELILKGCNDLVELQMPAESLKLEYLNLSHSKLKSLRFGNTPNLERLILEGCNDLVELQMPVENLKLKYLDLSHSRLKTIHLGNNLNLETLILKGCNDLVELQIPVENRKLEYLDLSHSQLKTIHLGNTTNLKELIIKGCNDLVELQMPIENLKLKYLDTPNLERLNLVNCYDSVDINAPDGCLRNRTFIDLRCCGRFKSFVFDNWSQPAEAGCLSELHLIAESTSTDVCPLYFDNDSPKFHLLCYYTEDPASSFGNLERLISIGLCACTNLESFSRSICGLECLRKLTFEGSIPEVPKDLDRLVFLEELNLSSTDIKILPDSICMLNQLKSLEIVSCWFLEKLPEDLGRLQCLEKLILSDCKVLQDLPNSMCKMKSLISLHLAECRRIMKLPEEMGRLGCLKELDITRSGISYLPTGIFQLKGLRIVGEDQIRLRSSGSTSKIQISENEANVTITGTQSSSRVSRGQRRKQLNCLCFSSSD